MNISKIVSCIAIFQHLFYFQSILQHPSHRFTFPVRTLKKNSKRTALRPVTVMTHPRAAEKIARKEKKTESRRRKEQGTVPLEKSLPL